MIIKEVEPFDGDATHLLEEYFMGKFGITEVQSKLFMIKLILAKVIVIDNGRIVLLESDSEKDFDYFDDGCYRDSKCI